jgi:hypothetical protein
MAEIISPSLSHAVELVCHWLAVPLDDRCKTVARARNMIRVGLLPEYKPGQGKAGTLNAEQLTRLTWATHLNLCGFSPELVIAAIAAVGYDELRLYQPSFHIGRNPGREFIVTLRNPLWDVVNGATGS